MLAKRYTYSRKNVCITIYRFNIESDVPLMKTGKTKFGKEKRYCVK